MMRNRLSRQSRFIGAADLINDHKNGINHLEGFVLMMPFVGHESNKIKLQFDVRLNIKKIASQYIHNPKGTKDLEIFAKEEIKQSEEYGYLKLKVCKKSGRRTLEGWMENVPIIGTENRKIKNRFHLEINDKKSDHLRNYNPDDAKIAEIEFKEVKIVESQNNLVTAAK